MPFPHLAYIGKRRGLLRNHSARRRRYLGGENCALRRYAPWLRARKYLPAKLVSLQYIVLCKPYKSKILNDHNKKSRSQEAGINYYLKRFLRKTKNLRDNSKSVQIKATKTRTPKTIIKLLGCSIHQRIKISTKIIVILQR